MQISAANKLVLFVGAIAFVLWGGYNMGKSLYVAATWEEVQGTVTGFERNTWSCGRSVSVCYELVVTYQADGRMHTALSDEKFDHKPPGQLLNKAITVYYNPVNPASAELAEYGPGGYGAIVFTMGAVVLFVFWLFRNKT